MPMDRLDWEKVVEEGLIGRDVQILDKSGYYRGPIKSVEITGVQLVITFEWLAFRHHSFRCWEYQSESNPIERTLGMDDVFAQDMGMERIYAQIGTFTSWVIFPNNGENLKPERVKGFPQEQQEVPG